MIRAVVCSFSFTASADGPSGLNLKPPLGQDVLGRVLVPVEGDSTVRAVEGAVCIRVCSRPTCRTLHSFPMLPRRRREFPPISPCSQLVSGVIAVRFSFRPILMQSLIV